MEQKENFVDPYFRPRRTVVFKSDHPNAYKNPGHLGNPGRELFLEQQRARVYTAWEPPRGDEPRQGKKILGVKPKNDGIASDGQE